MLNRSCSFGLTLVELLLAIAISAALAVYTFNMMSTVSSGQERIEHQRLHLEHLRFAESLLEKDMMQIVQNRPVTDEYGEKKGAIEKDSEILAVTRSGWTKSIWVENPRSNLQRVEYALASISSEACTKSLLIKDRERINELEGSCLLRRHWQHLDPDSSEEPKVIPVLAYLEEAKFKILYTNSNGESEWTDVWPPDFSGSQGKVPVAKVIELDLVHQIYGNIKRRWEIPQGNK